MFKLIDMSASCSDIYKGKRIGFKNRLAKKFIHKQTRLDDTEITRAKTRKKTKHNTIHENIYDVDEIDSKFEGSYKNSIANNCP